MLIGHQPERLWQGEQQNSPFKIVNAESLVLNLEEAPRYTEVDLAQAPVNSSHAEVELILKSAFLQIRLEVRLHHIAIAVLNRVQRREETTEVWRREQVLEIFIPRKPLVLREQLRELSVDAVEALLEIWQLAVHVEVLGQHVVAAALKLGAELRRKGQHEERRKR